jgi:hypothetical protein
MGNHSRWMTGMPVAGAAAGFNLIRADRDALAASILDRTQKTRKPPARVRTAARKSRLK